MHLKNVADGLYILAIHFPKATISGYNEKIIVNPGHLQLVSLETLDVGVGSAYRVQLKDGDKFVLPAGWHVTGVYDPQFTYSTES